MDVRRLAGTTTIGIVLAFGLALAGCTVGPAPTAAPGPPALAPDPPLSPPVRVRAGTLGLLTEAGLYIAYERGYFREEGLDVELVRFARGAEQTPALATGELHFGVGAPDASLFNAAARGVGLKIVSPNAVSNDDDAAGWLVVRQDLVDSGRYRDLPDLKGLHVAVNGGFSIATVRLERILDLARLTPGDIQMSVVPYPDMFVALANKAVDAGILAEPFVTASRTQAVAPPVVRLGSIYPGIILQALVISPVFARDQPEAARRFVTAHLRGQRDYYRAFIKRTESRDDIVRILIEHTQIKDPETYAQMGSHGVDPNGGISEQVLDELQDYFLRNGVQQQRVPSSQVVDRSYLEYALQRLGYMAE